VTVGSGRNVPGPSANQGRRQLHHNGIAAELVTSNWKAASWWSYSRRGRARRAAIWWWDLSQGTGCGKWISAGVHFRPAAKFAFYPLV